MPKQLKRNTTKRKTQDPRDTFDFSTPNLRPQARPTDPYVREFQDTKAKGITSIVRNINSSVKSYGDYQQSQKRANTMKARADHLRGQERDKPKSFFNLGVGYDEAYNLIDGEARAIKLNDEYALAMTDNGYFANVKDKDKAREELWQSLYQKHFSGASDDDYTKAGAQDLIYRGKEKIDILAIEADYSLATQKFMNNVKTSQMDYIKHVGNDVQALRHGADLEWEKLRDYVSSNPLLKERYLPDRTAFTKMYIDNMYQTADNIIDKPDTSLMEKEDQINNIFEALEMQGKDGISWTAKVGVNGKELFGDSIRQHGLYYQKRLDLLEKEQEKIDTEFKEQAFVSSKSGMVNASSPGELSAAYADFMDNKKSYSKEDADNLMMYFDRKSKGGHYVREIPTDVSTLKQACYRGDITEAELLAKVGIEINDDTYAQNLSILQQVKAKAGKDPMFDKHYKHYNNMIKSLLNPSEGMLKGFNSEALTKQQEALDEYYTLTHIKNINPIKAANYVLKSRGFNSTSATKGLTNIQRCYFEGIWDEAKFEAKMKEAGVTMPKKEPEPKPEEVNLGEDGA